LIDQYGSSVNFGLFLYFIQLSIKFQSQLIARISDVDNFMTLDQTKKLMLQTRSLQDDLNLKGLLERMRHIKSEKNLIYNKS
jgi:hypothetical protein